MTDKDSLGLQDILRSLPFVQWDRYTVHDGSDFKFYGWIDREEDCYKDFVLLSYDSKTELLSYTTSSTKYTAEIGRILFGDNSGHAECVRVEKDFDIPNVVRLK